MNNELLQAVAARLTALWPKRPVRVEEVAAGADGSFFVELNNPRQQSGLDRQRRRDVTVTVIYFAAAAEQENLEYYAWADRMFAEFETLEAGGKKLRCENLHAEKGVRVYHFVFDVCLRGLVKDSQAEPMEQLEHERKD